MACNVVIAGKDNPISVTFTGVDLTLATKIEVRLGGMINSVTVDSVVSPQTVVIASATELHVYPGFLGITARDFIMEVIYYDGNSVGGTMIAGRQLGNEVRVSVDSFSTLVTHEILPAGANSYVSYIEFVEYCLERGLPVPKTISEGERVLLDAMDYLATFEPQMQGYRSTREQPLMWPRRCVYLYGWTFDSNEIPREIKRAQMEAAAFAVENTLMHNETLSNVKREKLDVLETEYFESGARASTTVRLKRVTAALQPLLMSNDTLLRT